MEETSVAPQEMIIRDLFKLQKTARWRVAKSSAVDRAEKLNNLKKEILKRKEDLGISLEKDFRKPRAESILTEVYPLIDEINYTIKNLENWMQNHPVTTPILMFPSKSELQYQARGQVLIMAPWNYPFLLAMNPVVAAVAAGNVVILKPSEKTHHTALLISEIIAAVFPAEEVSAVLGDYKTAELLLELPFDHFFFTGSTQNGRKVMTAAAKHLASVTLELGGKSPAIVHNDADLKASAQRICWAKFVNSGQTCVTPDYILVHHNVLEKFIDQCKTYISDFYGPSESARESSPDFARIIDATAFHRISKALEASLAEGAKLEIGGVLNEATRYISPTVLRLPNRESSLMKQEIFGPVMPILSYENLDEAIESVQGTEKPLALYIFSENPRVWEKIQTETTSGGCVINHCVIHLANPHLPFGGVGTSGMGNYHGFFGFKAFSHERAILRQKKGGLTHWLFPPYSAKRFQKLLHALLWTQR